MFSVDEKIFCCHGGLSPDLQSMEQIRRIMRPTDVPDTGTTNTPPPQNFYCHPLDWISCSFQLSFSAFPVILLSLVLMEESTRGNIVVAVRLSKRLG